MTITFTTDEEESSEVLNNHLHGLLGFHTIESETMAWKSLSKSTFDYALQALHKFQLLHKNIFFSSCWNSRIQKFLGNHFFAPSLDPTVGSTQSFPSEKIVLHPSNHPPVPIAVEVEHIHEPTHPFVTPTKGVDHTYASPVPCPSKGIPLHKRFVHSSGGSASTVPIRKRNPKTPAQLKENDFNRALRKLGGLPTIIELCETWGRMDTQYGGLEWEKSEGIIIGLINTGLSQKKIRVVLPIGGHRCSRLKKVVDTNFENFHTKHGK